MINRVYLLIKPYMWRIYLAMACMGMVALFSAIIAFLVKPVIDEIFINQDLEKLYLVSFLIFLAFIIKGFFFFCQAYIMNWVGQTVVNDLRVQLYRHLQTLSLSFFNNQPTGVLTSRITNDIARLRRAVTDAVTGLIMDVATAICLTVYIVYLDWKLALFGILVLPLAGYLLLLFGRRIRSMVKNIQTNMGLLTTILIETFQGTRIVKAFNMEEYENKRMAKISNRILSREIKVVALKTLSTSVMETLGGFSIAGIILYGGISVVKGQSTPGTFMSFLTALIMLYQPIRRLSRVNALIQQGLGAADRIFEFMDEVPEIQDKETAIDLPRSNQGVEFRNVRFSYGQEEVLKGINLKVEAGEALAIVGSSGVGKTTLVDLIPRFYDVDEGSILVNGIDIRDLTLKSLRSQIGIVSQNTILFDDTVQNNIAYGSPERSIDEIEAAARSAYTYEFIKNMPKGFDTLIGEQGVRLSGGERQRLAIARALVKDAPILILDEATSSLDTESEQQVQRALANLMRGRTTFVIAHRLSTIREADRIIVLADGQIIETGTHDELMALNGEYRKLYDLQFSLTERMPADDHDLTKTSYY